MGANKEAVWNFVYQHIGNFSIRRKKGAGLDGWGSGVRERGGGRAGWIGEWG